MGLFSSSDPAKAEAKLAETEAKHEEITIKNALKEVSEAESAVKAQLKAVESHAKVHNKISEKTAKAAEKLREATAHHDTLAAEEAKELAELDARKSKHAELEEQVAMKKNVVERLKERHQANSAARSSPATPTGPSAAAGVPTSATHSTEHPTASHPVESLTHPTEHSTPSAAAPGTGEHLVGNADPANPGHGHGLAAAVHENEGALAAHQGEGVMGQQQGQGGLTEERLGAHEGKAL